MACTGGFPGTFNDKTISRYDQFIRQVGSEEIFTSFEYNIQTENGPETRTGDVIHTRGNSIKNSLQVLI
jgi:hypothetical protein